jgi:hypothetical protein
MSLILFPLHHREKSMLSTKVTWMHNVWLSQWRSIAISYSSGEW